MLLNVSYVFAENCKIDISGSDMMKFDTNEINIDWEDEIIIGTALTKNGEIIHKEFIK